MRYAILLIMASLCLSVPLFSQTPVTDRIISVKYQEIPLSFILKDIQKRYAIHFSYTNNLASLGKKITVDISNKPLKNILEVLLDKTDISYQVIGNQVVLKKLTSPRKYPEKAAFSGQGPALVSMKASKEMLSDTSLEKPIPPVDSVVHVASINPIPPEDSVINPLTMNYRRVSGRDQKSLDKEYQLARKQLKEEYIRISDSLNQTDKSTSKTVKANIYKLLYSIQNEITRIGDTLKVHNERKKKTDVQTYDSTGYVYRPIEVSFVTPLGTNGKEGAKTVNNVSLNIIGGYSAGLEGVEASSVFNIENDYMHGSQFSGVVNSVHNDVTGTQMAGVMNLNGGHTNGLQLAGLINIVNDSLKGLQGAGFANIVKGRTKGTQLAGFMNSVGERMQGTQFAGFSNMIHDSAEAVQVAGALNITSGKITGFQAAGLGNIAGGDVNGTQVSGLFNIAKKVKGSQIGIINIADSVTGAQIGILSFSRKGYRRVELSGSELLYGNVAYKMGTKKFYNIFSVGARVSGQQYAWGLGLGFGTSFDLHRNASLSIDAVCNQINENEFWTKNNLNLLNQLKLTAGLRIWGNNELFAGPVWSVMVSNTLNKDGTIGTQLAPWSSYQGLSGGTMVRMWPGFNVGLRF
jgi:hypothetical protein